MGHVMQKGSLRGMDTLSRDLTPAWKYLPPLLLKATLKGKNLPIFFLKVSSSEEANSCLQSCFPLQNSDKIFQVFPFTLTLVLLNPDITCLCKQCRSRSVGYTLFLQTVKIQISEETN